MGDAAKAARSSALGVKAKAAGASGAGKGKKSTVRDAEKKVVFKGYLQSGLEPQWPKIPSGPTQEIRAQLEALAAATRSPRRVRAGGKVRRGADAGPAAPESAMAVDEAAPTAGGAEGEATLRADLAVGVNEVTRGLEKGRVELVCPPRSSVPRSYLGWPLREAAHVFVWNSRLLCPEGRLQTCLQSTRTPRCCVSPSVRFDLGQWCQHRPKLH
eukprot:m.163382 g.163382  ORF g.163382 m.163382 type:complete len:214 (-) comp14634_c0_seq1:452-1093(-)